MRRLAGVTILLAGACSSAPPGATAHPASTLRLSPKAAPALMTPARWVYAEPTEVAFDASAIGSPVLRPEPAIIEGVRVMLMAGSVVESAPGEGHWKGFASLPERLGGGFVMWTDESAAFARTFFGRPEPLEGEPVIGAHDARPWLSSMLLRSDRGFLAVDPRAPKRVVRRADLGPGIVEARAVDALHGLRVDAVGRASMTSDGGASWTDLEASQGKIVSGLAPVPASDDVALLVKRDKPLLFSARGLRTSAADAPEPFDARSRALAGDPFRAAIASGVEIAGDRLLGTRAGGLEVFALRTGLSIGSVDLPYLDARVTRCDVVPLADGGPLLACTEGRGAAVFRVEDALGRLGLEATFAEALVPATAFAVDPRGRLAYLGRCGSDPPSSGDLAEPATSDGGSDPAVSVSLDASANTDDVRVCVRVSPSRWIERRLRGPDAHVLARWIPGDGGDVTALLLAPPGSAATVAAAPEGVRIVRLDPDDDALKGAVLAATHGLIDRDFWLDDVGAVRGWLVLDDESQPLEDRRGGPAGGLRVDADGHATRYPLPDGVVEVVHGGRFALAMAEEHESKRWYETTDGGASWTAIPGPVAGRLAAPADDSAFGCSGAGCAWAGMARVGWGSGPPAEAHPDPREAPAEAASVGVEPSPVIACQLGAISNVAEPEVESIAHADVGGVVADRALHATVFPPFQPTSPARSIVLPGADDAQGPHGALLPLLPADARAPLDLVITAGDRWMRVPLARAPRSRVLADQASLGTLRSRVLADQASLGTLRSGLRVSSAAELPGGAIALTDGAAVWIANGANAALALRFTLPDAIPPPTFALARRIDRASGGLALVGYSSRSNEVFAGDIDLGRGEVGPLAALGRLDALAAPGACPGATHRFVLQRSVTVDLGSVTLPRGQVAAQLLVRADATHLCVDAVEAEVKQAGKRTVVLRATLGSQGVAIVAGMAGRTRGTCTLRAPLPREGRP